MRYVLSKPLCVFEIGKRDKQEDALFPIQGVATERDRTFVLCDGMGGHEGGEVASNIVCVTIGKCVSGLSLDKEFTEKQFHDALQCAYDELDKNDNGCVKKMGTTLAFLRFHKKGCFVAHIGDSRIYHVRPSKRKILYRSRDHSLVQDLFDIGEITKEEMKKHPGKNIITRVMLPNQEKMAKADIYQIENICSGDYFFMCSDGMLEKMEDKNLLNILCTKRDSDEEKVRILMGATAKNRDNHSAYLIHVLDVIEEENEKISHKVIRNINLDDKPELYIKQSRLDKLLQWFSSLFN